MDSPRMGREAEKRQRQSADDTPSGGTIKDGGPLEAFTAPFQEEENNKPTVGQRPQASPAVEAEEGTTTKATKATKAKRPGNSTPILHSDVEKLRRERLNYFVDELRNLVPVSSTGICESHRTRRPKYAVLADATHYIRELQAKVKRLEEQHSDFSGRAQQHDAGRGNLLGAEQPRLAIPGIPSASGLPATDVDNRQAARPDVKMSEAAQASDAKADDDLRLSVDVMGNRLDRTVQIFVSHVGSVSERDILYHALLSILSEMVITQLANVRCIQRTAPNSNIQQLRGAHGQDAAGQTTASASTIDNARDGDKDGIKYNITLLLSPSYNHSIAALKFYIKRQLATTLYANRDRHLCI